MNEATETMDVVKDAATTTEAPSRPPTGGARHEAHQQSRTASEKGSSSSSTSSPPAAPSTGQQQEKHTEDEKQEKITRSTDDDYPEGGTRAWLVAAGTAGILFCSLGYTNSFGVFQAYYMRNQLRDHTPDDISWIGSIQAFLVFASGAIGGPVFDRYGAWVSSIAREQL